MKDHFSFRSFVGFLCFIRVGIYSRLLRCGYGVVQKFEMPRNVWKHLFLLFSPKSTYEKHETCRPLFALKKNHGSRTRLGYLRKRRQIYKKIRVLSQAANALNIMVMTQSKACEYTYIMLSKCCQS